MVNIDEWPQGPVTGDYCGWDTYAHFTRFIWGGLFVLFFGSLTLGIFPIYVLRTTGFRARDFLAGGFHNPFLFRAVWRWTASERYWEPRSDLTVRWWGFGPGDTWVEIWD